MRRLRSFLLLPALLWAGPLYAQSAPAATAAPITDDVVLDGRLDEAFWGSAQRLDGFTQREPVEGRPVSERTEVRVAYDGTAIYVGAWLFDRDMSSLTLGQTIRDAQINDRDAFLIAFDTYRDRQNGFVCGTTPSGL